jgi:dihydroneopterin aldolase/2-amino-4-hydroxy-6-hydroxymethyldihydropteridine diphosphokinase
VRARGFHGVLERERREGQDFVVDVELEVDLARAGASDDLAHTVSYAEVASDVVARVEGEPFDLIERLAEVIAGDALARPLVESVVVTVHKPQAPVGVSFGDVAVRVERHRPWVPVVVALGANLGDRERTLSRALARLRRSGGLRHLRVSQAFETDPVGGPDQPAYLNAVAVGQTRHTPLRLLSRLHAIEDDFGRTREIRWGARSLDLDVIAYGNPDAGDEIRSEDPELTLPHPRAAGRAFVLVPWLDADAGARLRVGGGVVAVADLVADLDASGVRPVGPLPPTAGGWH